MGAIIEANRRGGCNTIVLSSTNYPLTIQGADEDNCLTGDLDILRGSLTIIGTPDSYSTISGSGSGGPGVFPTGTWKAGKGR